MIPKKIHYCWFGNNPMPDLAIKCIESWKKYLPDYELCQWNEDTFDVNVNSYVAEAYKVQKYAFVTDYVRLWVLYNYGGIYMDTDVEVLKSYNDLLSLPAFTGYEKTKKDIYCPVTGMMASEAGGIWVKEQLEYYNKKHFIRYDGTFDLTSNTDTITSIMKKNGFIVDGKYSVYKDNMHVFPSDYFCPKQWETGEINITENTYCIHHFTGSWKAHTSVYKKTPLQNVFFFLHNCWKTFKKPIKTLLKK